jgi:UrcA family protein
MRHTINPFASRTLCAGLAVAGLALAAVPAWAQSVSEVTVTGRGGVGDNVRSLSQAVSYADLDLTTGYGADTLKFRIKDTATALCRQLGESGSSSGVVASCEDSATADAMKQARIAIASAEPRGIPLTASAAGMSEPAARPATGYATDTSAIAPAPASSTYTTSTVTNGPVADTPENRARFGGPMSNAGRNTSASGD